MADYKNPMTDKLFSAISSLTTPEQCRLFFEDLCTIAEIQEMSRRLLAAKLLREDKVYNEIAAQTGLSTATISRVNRCLKYGSDGYLSALEKLDRQDKHK